VLGDGAQELDRVDRAALEEVFSVCSATSSMAEAGKLLFARSRERRSSTNDSDRVKKYLTRYGLTWAQVQRKLVGR
jgi:transcriptional regulatory protein RtcR